MFYIATRNAKTGQVAVEYHRYTTQEAATSEAAEFTARNGLKRRNVIVVEANDDAQALDKARVVFTRGG